MPDIAFWNKCNNKCVMCTNSGGFPSQDTDLYSLKFQIRKMESYLLNGGIYPKNSDKPGFLCLTGGEPTLHPDCIKLLAYFRRRSQGLPMIMLTNGRRFADPSFTGAFLKAAKPPFCAAVAVHGPDAKLHDRITGVRGSFTQTVAGLENLFVMRAGQEVEIRIILHRLSVSSLGATLRFLLAKFPVTSAYRLVLIHYEMEGMSEKNHSVLSLRFPVSAEAVNSSLPLLKKFPALSLYHFPSCLVRRELRPSCRVTLPEEELSYPEEKCAGCGLRRKCTGLMSAYYRKFGATELKPRRVSK